MGDGDGILTFPGVNYKSSWQNVNLDKVLISKDTRSCLVNLNSLQHASAYKVMKLPPSWETQADIHCVDFEKYELTLVMPEDLVREHVSLENSAIIVKF